MSTGAEHEAPTTAELEADEGFVDQSAGAPLDAFERLVQDAIDDIPEPFASQLGSVAIVIEDWPNPDQLARVQATGLFGLYEGVPRTTWGADLAQVPSKITIFRGTLEAVHRDPDSLASAVRDTVWHEVAHHLGISDARLHELGR